MRSLTKVLATGGLRQCQGELCVHTHICLKVKVMWDKGVFGHQGTGAVPVSIYHHLKQGFSVQKPVSEDTEIQQELLGRLSVYASYLRESILYIDTYKSTHTFLYLHTLLQTSTLLRWERKQDKAVAALCVRLTFTAKHVCYAYVCSMCLCLPETHFWACFWLHLEAQSCSSLKLFHPAQHFSP